MEIDPGKFKISEALKENYIKSKSAADLKIPSHLNQEKPYRVGNYLIKNTLGSGTFGKVKLGIYIPTKEKVAIKIIEKSKMTEKDDLVRLEREFEMLAQFNHPNLIMVSEIFESDNNYYTVMDYCEEGELFNYIVKNKFLSEEESSFFYFQLINGLEYIHSLGIVHRDLKPENLLLTKDHILKIIDFGLSNYFKEGQNKFLYTPCGSPCYASPEMVTGNSYDGIMIDIWSTGIILFAMLCGYLPFEDKSNEKLFKKIAECKIEYPDYISEEALDLMKKIIVPNPKERITINEIKEHSFYIRGKKLFDKEFTIQFISDVDFNNKNEPIDNDVKPIDKEVKIETNKDDKDKNENKDENNVEDEEEIIIDNDKILNYKKIIDEKDKEIKNDEKKRKEINIENNDNIYNNINDNVFDNVIDNIIDNIVDNNSNNFKYVINENINSKEIDYINNKIKINNNENIDYNNIENNNKKENNDEKYIDFNYNNNIENDCSINKRYDKIKINENNDDINSNNFNIIDKYKINENKENKERINNGKKINNNNILINENNSNNNETINNEYNDNSDNIKIIDDINNNESNNKYIFDLKNNNINKNINNNSKININKNNDKNNISKESINKNNNILNDNINKKINNISNENLIKEINDISSDNINKNNNNNKNNIRKKKRRIKIKNDNSNNNKSINENKKYKNYIDINNDDEIINNKDEINNIENNKKSIENNINEENNQLIHKNKKNINSNKIKNKTLLINSFDNNTGNNTTKSTNFENINKSFNTNIKKNYHHQKTENNYLLIENLNNSVDNNNNNNKKINSKIPNLCFNKTISPKETNIKQNIYNSNTYSCNIKKDKNKVNNKINNNVVGRILKINVIENSKRKLRTKRLGDKEKIRKIDDDINKKLITKRNTFCGVDLKIYDSSKINDKKLSLQKKQLYTNIKNKLNSLTSNYHKYTISTDINTNFIPFDIKNKKKINKNNIEEFQFIDSNHQGNKSLRQDFYPMGLKKKNLKINSNLSSKNKNNLNKFNDFNFERFIHYNDSLTLKTETNEYMNVDNLDLSSQNFKNKKKMNNNYSKIESRLSSKDSNKTKSNKKTFYKIRNVVGIFSSNNLRQIRHLKHINNKNREKSENRGSSNKKKKYNNKFNIWKNDNFNKYNSENKIKKFNKIFIQQKINDIISNNYSIYNNSYNYNSHKSNYVNSNNSNASISNNNINKRSIISKNKSKKNIDKKIIFSNKNPNYYLEDAIFFIENNIRNNKIDIANTQSSDETSKNKNKNSTKLVKKNNNYIRIKKKLNTEIEKRRKNISKNKVKIKQKSIGIEESFNLKEVKNSNTMRNPFHQSNRSTVWGEDKKNFKKQKINIKKNINDKINSNNRSKTFISFNINKLSHPKIKTVSPKYKKYSNFYDVNNINSNNIRINNNHFRQNTLPGTLSSQLPKKYIKNNFMNIQQNIIDNIDNQKLFTYANTEYEQYNNFTKNIKNKIFNKKNKSIGNVLNSNFKISKENKNRIIINTNMNNK